MLDIRQQKGVAMLLLVVVLTASFLIVASSILFLGLGELDMGYTYQCGEEAFALADGCMEEVLIRLKMDNNYSGGNLDLGSGNCIINISGDATYKIISAVSVVKNCSQGIEANISLAGDILTINTWREK
ncbi:MAG: hypothetical protein BWY51_00637 [Parcubacteria group bacterium ADurb.Bin316]|nr:MAG: hypothetical protein BWY51_00637 [Parcubacteria group bacterium ADurb.Bin316]HOZ55829.1 hypothetical protein [bacterium]